jgi:hypothetical protein
MKWRQQSPKRKYVKPSNKKNLIRATRVRINDTLIKSRNPDEHHIDARGMTGIILQSLGDGWTLIKLFKDDKPIVSTKVTELPNGRKFFKARNLEWYFFEGDFTVINNGEKNRAPSAETIATLVAPSLKT